MGEGPGDRLLGFTSMDLPSISNANGQVRGPPQAQSPHK